MKPTKAQKAIELLNFQKQLTELARAIPENLEPGRKARIEKKMLEIASIINAQIVELDR